MKKGFTLREYERSKSGGRNKGFTLIELLVVIAVIGLLASIVLVSVGPARGKARDARRQSDIRQINLAMEMCYDDSSCNTAQSGGTERYFAISAGTNSVIVIGNYMPTGAVPKDPTDTDPLQYKWTISASPFQYYCVYSKLEAETNTFFCGSNKGVFKKTAATYTPSDTDCCGPNVTN